RGGASLSHRSDRPMSSQERSAIPLPQSDGSDESPLDPLGLTAEAYAAACARQQLPGGKPGAFARYTALFREGLTTQKHVAVSVPPVARRHTSESLEGTTLKFTQAVPNGGGRQEILGSPSPSALETESVLIPMVGRKGHQTFTLCVSSQIGCAMGCTFCQTAQ